MSGISRELGEKPCPIQVLALPSHAIVCQKTNSLLFHRLLDHKPSTPVHPPIPCDFFGTQTAPHFPYRPCSAYPGSQSSLPGWQFLCLSYLLDAENPSLSRRLGQMPKVNMPKPEQATALLRPLPATKARVQPLRGLHWSLPIGAICDLLQATPNTLPPTLPYGPLLSPGDTQSEVIMLLSL